MSDPASGFSGVGEFVEQHRTASIIIGGGVVLVVLYLYLSSGSTPAPQAAAAPNDDTATEAAAAIQSAQTTANSNAALATIAAGVTDNQTAAAQTVALATLQSQTQATVAAASATTAQAYYGAASSIADSNSQVAIAGTQAAAVEQTAQDSLLGNEYGDLAAAINGFGKNITSMVNTNTATGLAFGQAVGQAGVSFGGQLVSAAQADAATTAANDALIAAPAYTGAAPGGWLNQPTFGFQNPGLLTSLGSGGGAAAPGVSALAGSTLSGIGSIFGTTSATAAASTAAASNTFLSFMSGLLSAFTGSAAASSPVTQAPSVTQVTSLNLAPLAGGPQMPVLANLTAF